MTSFAIARPSTNNHFSEHLNQPLEVSPTTTPSGLFVFFSCWRFESHLEFAFEVDGPEGQWAEADLVIPEICRSPRRTNGLWKATCLEIFLQEPGEKSYLEINLSPSGNWNIYQFDDYRVGMKEVKSGQLKLLSSYETDTGHTWIGSILETEILANSNTKLVLGASTVLQYKSNNLEYWALKHCCDKPDFHQNDSFVLGL